MDAGLGFKPNGMDLGTCYIIERLFLWLFYVLQPPLRYYIVATVIVFMKL
jgi:hypothetical protein